MAAHAAIATGWTKDVVVFTDGRFELPTETRAALTQRGIRIDTRRLKGFVSSEDGGARTLAAVELEDGVRLPCKGLMARPPQHQTKLVAGMQLALDDMGLVSVDPMGKTSRAGIYAAGDLCSMMQSALGAAAAGQRAAAALNHELVTAG
jgi:thioredoxin reductase